MADKKISELTTASEIKNGDNLELSQDTGSGLVSLKATILAIANKMLKGINFTSDLQTTDKTVIGAINEVAQGGGGGGASTEIIADDFDVTSTYAVGDYVVYDGKLYKCTTAVSTAGQWDANDWIETIVMDEVGQGGGGTGGHTIIDENGNSMTARAGLQFVGGANVSDDAINNKTIVDLASASGIDGVFIDTSNVIVQPTSYTPSSFSYMATEDCALYIEIPCKGGFSTFLQIDGVNTQGFNVAGSNTTNYGIVTALLKKGQVATLSATEFPSVTPDYAVYGIQTGTTHSKFQPVIYSTEEQEIGVWIDGKPLYQKTYDNLSINLSTQLNWTDTELSSQDIETYVFGFVTDQYKQQFPSVFATLTSTSTIGLVVCGNMSQRTITGFTIQYTKTTDTAGSGSWTPQGVPTHHYSTDEQVVGTYLGETLYEKTFDLGSDLVVPYNSWVSLGITLDANKIIETKTTATVGSFQGNILMYNDNGTWKGTSPRNNDGSYVRYLTIQYTKTS